MQNRFGLKDFVLLAVLLATLGSVWLSMVQKTRMELTQQDAKAKLAEIEQQVAQLSRKVEKGFEQLPQAALDAAAAGGARASAGQPAPAADGWARPGVKVERWPSPRPESDPEGQPGFALGGEFTELFEAQPAKLTPYISTDVYGTRVIDRVCETLGSFDPKTLRMEGKLADGWQIDPDGLWIRAHINPRARFSDGQPVTAEDVRWTFLEFIANPLIEAERSRSLHDNLKDVKVVDERTVEFVFGEPLFTNILIALGNPILPRHYYSRFEPSQVNQATGLLMGSGQFRVEKMRFPSKDDKSRILYNSHITVENIPAEAYAYVVNGKSAIEWVMERYAPSTHKDSGIHNDPNDWALEQGKPRYILDLLLSVIHLSLKTVELVKQLPAVTFGE